MRKELLQSILITFVFLTCGFVMLEYNLIGYGFSFFTFLPFIIDYVLGQGRLRKISLYGFIFTLITFLILLLFGDLEGIICILAALPYILIMFAIGYIVKRLYDYLNKKYGDDSLLKSSILPLFHFVFFGLIEKNTQRQL